MYTHTQPAAHNHDVSEPSTSCLRWWKLYAHTAAGGALHSCSDIKSDYMYVYVYMSAVGIHIKQTVVIIKYFIGLYWFYILSVLKSNIL